MNLSERIKLYEKIETQDKFLPLIPIIVRLDGRSFSNFTRNMTKPYDPNMSNIMQNVTKRLIKESSACIGYTQSDEISLVFLQKSIENEVFFNSKKQKLISVLSSIASTSFLSEALELFPVECSKTLPVFDCRAFQVPNKIEAVNAIMSRVQDATRNSVQMAASAIFSHSQLQGKSKNEMLDMLLERGINWNEYPKLFKEGTFFQRTPYYNQEGVLRHSINEVLEEIKFQDLSTEERVKLFFGDDDVILE